MRNAVRLALLTLFVTLLSSTAGAQQYFGRNKVQWESFDFKVLQTEHFDIYYYDEEADVVHDVGRMAERWYARLSRVFNHSFKRKPIVLYANAADFHQTTTTGGFIGEGTGGFTDAFMNRVVLPLTGDRAEDDHVLGHEMVHVFQYDVAATAVQNRRRFALEALPLWIVEGMAEYLSKGRVDPLTGMWIRDATDHDRLPTIGQLTRDPRYFPYRYGQAIMAYIGARFGDEAVVRYFSAAGSVGVEEGVERALGINAKQLFTDWKAAATELYAPVFQARPDTLTKPLIGRKPVRGEKRSRRSRGGTELNIGPALSPDGRYVAFISARDLFSIDLFLADARTGQIIRKLVSEDRDAHFESLRFLESAGSWSPDARKLAFVTFAKGDNHLSIVDVESRATEHIKVPGVEAIMNVAWSPDGSTIALAGQRTGSSDLFLYNLSTKQVRQLTADKFSDLHPSWSPDGRMLTFISDRGPGTNNEQLKFARLGINTIDVTTGEVRQIPVFANAKHINPQFSADGRSIYFIANPEGVADIYRFDLTDRKTSRVTHVRTGVAGITELAPALSVARTGDIAFSVFEDDNYNIYTIPANSQGAVTLTEMPTGIPRPALLPPLRGTGSEITAYLSRPEEGLPPQNVNFQERAYDANLRLAYLGPPTLGVGVGQFGFGAGGSVSAWFSDVLGQHNVGFTFEGGGASSGGGVGIQDQIGGEIFYLNQKHRFNWGGGALRIPYIAATPVTVREQGQNFVYEQSLLVQTVTDVSGIAQYPFSTTRRIEGSAGVQQYGFKLLTDVFLVDRNGNILDRDTVTHASETINLAKASTAFVGDSSTYGFISPIRGTRYRYEIEALRGDINFQTGLADWRRYFFFRPLTLATRGLFYGRFGEGAEDSRLSTLYVGSGSIGRGYDPYTVDPSVECGPDPSTCPVIDRLIGTRLGAASVELRAPLFGTREFGLINAPFLPTEIFAFGDVAAAWTDDEDVTWKYATNTIERVPVFSVGVGVRLLLSYIPIEFFAAKPFQRPNESMVYGFNIAPGW